MVRTLQLLEPTAYLRWGIPRMAYLTTTNQRLTCVPERTQNHNPRLTHLKNKIKTYIIRVFLVLLCILAFHDGSGPMKKNPFASFFPI